MRLKYDFITFKGWSYDLKLRFRNVSLEVYFIIIENCDITFKKIIFLL